MPTVRIAQVGGAVAPDLVRRLSSRGAEITPVEPGAYADSPHDFDYAIVDWTRIEADHEEFLHQAVVARRGLALVFPKLTTDALHDVILRWPCIDLALDPDSASTMDPSLIDGGDPEPATTVIDDHEIGSSFPIQSPADYEEQRFLSLVQPGMRTLLAELRLAIDQMRRPHMGDALAPPWDPRNGQPRAVERRGDRFVFKDKFQHPPNLVDVLAAHDDDRASEYLKNQAGHGPRSEGDWARLPPAMLILGESGAGKGLVADLVHRQLVAHQAEDKGPTGILVKVNCGGLGVENLDHELFGSAPGTWSDIGAVAGLLTQAAYGVAFLDEIGDLPAVTQSRLLGFLDDRMLRPTGMTPFFGFVQVIGATNRDLDNRVELGRFRNDLLMRFTARVTVPPIRVRCGPAEMRHLIDFVTQNPAYNPEDRYTGTGRSVTHINAAAMESLLRHQYRDGNFRELEAVLSEGLRRARLARSDTVQPEHLTFREPRFRPEVEERVVRVKQVDTGTVAVQMEVQSDGELRRIAELTGKQILKGSDSSRLVVIDDDIAYWFDPGSGGSGPAPSQQ